VNKFILQEETARAAEAEQMRLAQEAERKRLEAERQAQEKAKIVVPSKVHEGKTPRSICIAMRNENYSDEVIAYALHKWHKIKKAEIGKILHGDSRTDDANRKRVVKLLTKAQALNVINDIN
jgi:hypothetical protein